MKTFLHAVAVALLLYSFTAYGAQVPDQTVPCPDLAKVLASASPEIEMAAKALHGVVRQYTYTTGEAKIIIDAIKKETPPDQLPPDEVLASVDTVTLLVIVDPEDDKALAGVYFLSQKDGCTPIYAEATGSYIRVIQGILERSSL